MVDNIKLYDIFKGVEDQIWIITKLNLDDNKIQVHNISSNCVNTLKLNIKFFKNYINYQKWEKLDYYNLNTKVFSNISQSLSKHDILSLKLYYLELYDK